MTLKRSFIAVFLLCFIASAAQPSASLSLYCESTGCQPAVEGNRVQLIDDPNVFYDEMLESIRGAESFVFMEYYIFREDPVSTAIMDALAERAREGVRTCVILDYYGCAQHMEDKGHRQSMWSFRHGFLERYMDSGVDVVFFNRTGLLPRDHRKLTLVDGKVAYTGGMNVTDLYINGIKGVGQFWDMSLKIEGPAVQSFFTGFVRMWNKCGDRPLTLSFPEVPAPAGDVPLIVLETQGAAIHPNPEELFAALFSMAEHSIRFISGYFNPTPAIEKSLRDAARRGVDVEMLMGESTDMPPVIDRMLMRRAERFFQDDQLTLFIQPGGFHHEKVISIDGHLLLIGSHNLDQLSIKTNHEMSVLMDSEEVVAAFDAYFDAHANPDI